MDVSTLILFEYPIDIRIMHFIVHPLLSPVLYNMKKLLLGGLEKKDDSDQNKFWPLLSAPPHKGVYREQEKTIAR